MASSALQVVGFLLGVISWAGMIATCASPEWRKNIHGQTLIDSTLRYDGLWVRCKAFSTGQTSCNSYNSFFIGLPEVLQVCRALMIAALVLGFVAIIITIIGMKCTNISPGNQKAKAIVSMIGGLLFGIAAIFVGAAVSYYAHGVVQEYYNPVLDEDTPMHLRFQYGEALFVGWASLVLGLLGGVSLVFVSVFIILRLNASARRQHRHKSHPTKHLIPASQTSTSTHSKHPQKQNSIPIVIQHAPHNKPVHSSVQEHQKHHSHQSSLGKNGSLNSDASRQKHDNKRTSKSQHENRRSRNYNNTDTSRSRENRRQSSPDRSTERRRNHHSTGRKEYV